MADYCTIADVRAVGVPSGTTDAAITVAIASAMERVDVFTSWWWAPRTATLTASITPDGTARLSRPPISVSAVALTTGPGAEVVLPATSYEIETSTDLGSRDRLLLNGWSYGAYDTIVDRPRLFERRIRVTGSFGEDVTPGPVKQATALLAAGLVVSPSGSGAGGAVNVEGDADLGRPAVVPVEVLSGSGRSTTGDARADALLSAYRRNRTRVS